MNWDQIKAWTGTALNKPLVTISGTEVTLAAIILFAFIIFATYVLSLLLQRITSRTLKKGFMKKPGALAAILRLEHYFVMVVGFAVGLQNVGINMSAMFAAGAVFAIAIGFAMQNIIGNFVSGIILLVERSIKPGDILEVEGVVAKVLEMGIRTTVVRTWKEEDIIIPNSELAQSRVKNFTQRDETFRLGVVVGVTYSSDMEKVEQVLQKVAESMPWGLSDPAPKVLLQDFGSSSVDFGVLVSVENPWMQRVFMAELRRAIWFAFKENGIVIAFPQVDVHFDLPVSDGLAKITKVM